MRRLMLLWFLTLVSAANATDYTIDSQQDLIDLTLLSGKFNGVLYGDNTFTLTTDIDLAGVDPLGDGKGWLPIGLWGAHAFFAGTFDGGGYTISNMTINRPATDQIGLFGAIDPDMDSASYDSNPIKDLAVVDANVIGNSMVGVLIGGILGMGISNGYPVQNCYVSGTVTAGDGGYCGGFVGYSNNGYFLNCYADVTVNSIFSDCILGGFVGYDTIGTDAVNCYSVGLINNSAPVTGDTYAGGFIGQAAAIYATDCFWDTRTSNKLSDGSGGDATGKTTSQMQSEGTFLNWDFTDQWWMPAGDYPKLRVFGGVIESSSVNTLRQRTRGRAR